MRAIAVAFLSAALIFAVALCTMRGSDYSKQQRDEARAPASLAHIAGTDDLGRDRCTRMAAAVLVSLGGAALASFLAISSGLGAGVLSAYGPSWTASLVRYASDLFHTLPWLFLLMIVRAALPLDMGPWRSATITFLLFSLLGCPIFLRLNYERTKSFLRSDWMLQARAMGLGPTQQIAFLLPHIRPLFWAQFLLYLPACIISEANLGAMGLGVPEPLPSFGTFLAELQSNVLLDNTWLNFLPLILLVSLLIAIEIGAAGESSR